jgi:hypothetical protein
VASIRDGYLEAQGDPQAIAGMPVPTWDECVAALLGRLHVMVAEGRISINDARTILYLAGVYRDAVFGELAQA